MEKNNYLVAFSCTVDNRVAFGNTITEIKDQINGDLLRKIKNKIEKDANVKKVIILNIINLNKL